jgi:ATPase AAA-2 domain-containing protein
MQENVMQEVRQLFKPEFLNRIDETIVFHQLTKANLTSIIDIVLEEINKRTKEHMGLVLEVTDEAKAYLVDVGYDKKYGARPLKRALQNQLEDKIAEAILDGEVKENSTVLVDVDREGQRKILLKTLKRAKKNTKEVK